jgi:serine/threonine protein kinase/dienelactone hydrolase
MDERLRTELDASLAGSYELLEELEGGGMSRVFRAVETRLGRDVVIKVLPRDLAAGVSAERFEREIQLAAALQDPHVVPILSAGRTESGLPFFTMPFVAGRSLRERLEDGPVPLAEAMDIVRDVAMALDAAHRHGVIHRDVKPGNVLLTGRSAVVTDFGIAKALSEARTPGAAGTLTTAGLSIGTPAYMSPEQAGGDPIDPRSDLYSWGILAYELLAGRHPFGGKTSGQQYAAAHLSETPRPLREVNPRLPAAVAALVMGCLAKDPEQRPASATALLDALRESFSELGSPTPAKRRWIGIGAAGASVVVVGVALFASDDDRQRWARDEASSEAAALASEGRIEEAFEVVREALAIVPGDSALMAAAADLSRPVTITSDPPGARVQIRPYRPGTVWQELGTTPLVDVRIPAVPSRVRIEAEGPGATVTAAYFITGLGHLEPEVLAPFQFGRYEVTNAEFQRFVDARGYARPELWADELRDPGAAVAWADAVAGFTDATGQPGPATWEFGTYPAGTGDHPVGGISWYEADAFARFSGLKLPTIYHWMLAASSGRGGLILPESNVGTAAVAPVGAFTGISEFGASDVAGNVREWAHNATGGDRFIMGGSVRDPAYMFYHVNYRDPFDRAPENGVRLARYEEDPAWDALRRPIEHLLRDFDAETVADDDVFAVYRRLYDYDEHPLEARVEAVDTTDLWMRERITFTGPGQERVIGYLFLPTDGSPPYQTLLFFPGANSLIGNAPMPEAGYGSVANDVVRTGRALFHPIYEGTYERRQDRETGTWYPNESNAYRDLILTVGRELRRSVDYLETRPEVVDASSLAYYGVSWGGYLSGIMMAIEPRLQAGILLCPGLTVNRPQPEVDPFHFLPRVTIPVLMVDGEHDAIFPLESSQRPMYELLGSAAGEKRHVVVPDEAHCPTRTRFWSCEDQTRCSLRARGEKLGLRSSNAPPREVPQ